MSYAETAALISDLTDKMDYRVRPNVDGEQIAWIDSSLKSNLDQKNPQCNF